MNDNGGCVSYIRRQKMKPLIFNKFFNKEKLYLVAVFSLCAALLFGLLAFSINASKNKQISIARYIYNEYAMGEAYAEWRQALNRIEFEDSREYWDKVEKDWEALGLQVSWKYVCQVYKESVEKNIPFHTYFRRSFDRDFCSRNTTVFEVLFMLSIAFCVLACYCFKIARNYKATDIIENTNIKNPQTTNSENSTKKTHIQSTHDKEWYFSTEGVKAYTDLSSNIEIVKFFLEYLLLVAKEPQNFTMLYRLAYVMASSMVGSSLEFGGYPNVLDESKNPLIKFVRNNTLIDSEGSQGKISPNKRYCYSAFEKQMIKLLCVLHNETEEYTQQCLIANDPFKCLTFCDENTPATEMYKIERELIYMFSNGMSDNCKRYCVPYASSIMLLRGRLK